MYGVVFETTYSNLNGVEPTGSNASPLRVHVGDNNPGGPQYVLTWTAL